ncbi:component of translocase of the outer mitochondrial membrane complex [Erysiphe neolycopersici]|uniref:Component of translocase of the outer mitochondrial membrane complex n=1 Tax=Erysiphe neolycopersici TaxID=212602 RepID=A0A420H960_9PEZI|nr:component of translocase of the outer mitochondrial membrane complex [Erysiphe neolycopersici]
MAPKQRVVVSKAGGTADSHHYQSRPGPPSKNIVSSAYQTLTSPNNANVVRSLTMFGVAVAFFSSSWSEILLPPI